MTAIASDRSVFRGPLLATRALAAAWRGISRQHVGAAVLFGALVSGMHLIGGVIILRDEGDVNALWTVPSDQIGAFCIMLAVVVADHLTAGDARRRLPYILAVIAGAAVWAFLKHAGLQVLDAGLHWYSVENRDTSAAEAAWRFASGFLEWLLLGGAATFIFLDARRARAEQRRLRSAEIERTRTAKRMLESQLQAMQARIEPQFLFNTMEQVRRLYELDARLAERMLDDLIAYLRAAMPQMRDTTSTVGREMALVRAYRDIVKVGLGDRLEAEFCISDESAGGRMPPMMLLPLIDHAISRECDACSSQRTLRISSDVALGRLRVRIADSASRFSALEASGSLSSVRERLTALYGDRAQVQLICEHEAASQVTMEMPFEAVGNSRDRIDSGIHAAEHVS
jgi:histidine kinase